MNYRYFLPGLLLCCHLAAAQSPEYGKYKLTFHEEFDYPDPDGVYPSHRLKEPGGPVSVAGTTAGARFMDLWKVTNGNWGARNELYTAEHAYLSAPGIIRLDMSALAKPFTIPQAEPRAIHYHAGYLNLNANPSLGSGDGYGIVEARVRFPEQLRGGGKTTPVSFWLWGNGKTEIDIFDLSYRNYYDARVLDWIYNPAQAQTRHVTPDLSGTFHTCSAEWTPSIVRFYIDGFLIGSVDYEHVRAHPTQFNVELAIMPIRGMPDGQFMEIDWVKIWKRGCDTTDLTITRPAMTDPVFQLYSEGGRLFRHKAISISTRAGVLSLPQRVPTIMEAPVTTIGSAFVADQSRLVEETIIIDGNRRTRISNAFFEIRPTPCDTTGN